MFYVVQFIVNLILFTLCLSLSGIPKEYHTNLMVVAVICNVIGYIEGIIYENLE